MNSGYSSLQSGTMMVRSSAASVARNHPGEPNATGPEPGFTATSNSTAM